MILFPAAQLARIVAHAEAACPHEACGLIVGSAAGPGRWLAARVQPSPNLAAEPARRFEVDPRLRLALQRGLRGTPQTVIGLYHSHPDGPAGPSSTDAAQVFEPDLVWVIAALEAGTVRSLTAHLPAPAAGGFVQIPLRADAGGGYPPGATGA